MTKKQILIATITGAVALLLFDGLFQAIPNVGVRAVERFESAELTTAKFSELANQMAYIATEETVSLVAVKEADYYNLPKILRNRVCFGPGDRTIADIAILKNQAS